MREWCGSVIGESGKRWFYKEMAFEDQTVWD